VSKSTILAESQLTHSPHDTVTVELIEADETPAVVILRWPHQRRNSSLRHAGRRVRAEPLFPGS
jgi:hypothetical protein